MECERECTIAEHSNNYGLQMDRLQYVIEMRRRYSPPGMVNSDGSINQEFFKPKRIVVLQPRCKWGKPQRDALYKGLEVHGVGKWREIANDFLKGGKWDDQQIRMHAARLLGSQSLARYVGWKGNREMVEQEYARNKAIGESTGCWKGGMLVEDNNGTLRKYLSEEQQPVAATTTA
ncbi:hypothetical protein VOLCADRAFT_105588 [Volvox carteri f. nagariensis]|uniref:Myb-like domain-containing protein n=1 Tax=Volvox carteri f. nagariensis TaxID=3068 RepID=D8U1P6_VOLCA|nr:uncharacterized protein VOLCADRAFT_105588 [Volvox carteri f. nagariensis]EFJ46448.1 hypothetical protein VOLCADRAFT_105588 [Volvox carteri f. nagariensis]|eukprot:XP_002952601.1 hypothetical protein VOLCADRAFT_105588 [Volvox carteri f. nagariensis]